MSGDNQDGSRDVVRRVHRCTCPDSGGCRLPGRTSSKIRAPPASCAGLRAGRKGVWQPCNRDQPGTLMCGKGRLQPHLTRGYPCPVSLSSYLYPVSLSSYLYPVSLSSCGPHLILCPLQSCASSALCSPRSPVSLSSCGPHLILCPLQSCASSALCSPRSPARLRSRPWMAVSAEHPFCVLEVQCLVECWPWPPCTRTIAHQVALPTSSTR